MSDKFSFKSLKKKLKNIKFRKKEEDVPFYLPGDENKNSKASSAKNSNVESNRFDSNKGKSKSNFLKSLPGIFAPSKRRAVHRTYLILFFLCLFTFMGKFLNGFLIPKIAPKGFKSVPKGLPNFVINTDPTSDWASRSNLLKGKDIFATAQPGRDKKKTEKPVEKNIKCEESDNATSLPLKLVSTFVLQDSVKSLASVQVRSDKKTKKLRIGDEIDRMAEIKKITRLRLVIKNLQNGACEFLGHDQLEKESKMELPRVKSPRQQKVFEKQQTANADGIIKNGNTVCIGRSLIDEKMKNPAAILSEARAIPITNPDGTMSFKIVDIVPGSIYSHLDIQNNDVIKAINGKTITGMNAVMGLFSKIKTLPKLSLDIDRSGSMVPMQYQITKKKPTNCN